MLRCDQNRILIADIGLAQQLQLRNSLTAFVMAAFSSALFSTMTWSARVRAVVRFPWRASAAVARIACQANRALDSGRKKAMPVASSLRFLQANLRTR